MNIAIYMGINKDKLEKRRKMDFLRKEFSSDSWKKSFNHKNALNDSYSNKLFSIMIQAKLRKITWKNIKSFKSEVI